MIEYLQNSTGDNITEDHNYNSFQPQDMSEQSYNLNDAVQLPCYKK